MKEIKKGDIVSRKSYGNDIIFYVKEINKLVNQKRIAILKGINTRIVADAPVEDLKKLSSKEKRITMKNIFQNSSSNWVRYDKYEWRTSADGKCYITPTADAKPSIYNPIKDY